MLDLLNLGAPIEARSLPDREFSRERGPLIEAALKNQRTVLIAPLIAKGALNTDGKPDQRKIDAAFRNAIIGGKLAPVQTIWEVAGDTPHPALTFSDESDAKEHASKPSPVTLLLSHYYYDKNL
jgi:hypothetical protein